MRRRARAVSMVVTLLLILVISIVVVFIAAQYISGYVSKMTQESGNLEIISVRVLKDNNYYYISAKVMTTGGTATIKYIGLIYGSTTVTTSSLMGGSKEVSTAVVTITARLYIRNGPSVGSRVIVVIGYTPASHPSTTMVATASATVEE